MTLEKQKLALAKAFPEILVFVFMKDHPFGGGFHWENKGPVNWPTEGLAVLRECEESLFQTELLRFYYVDALVSVTKSKNAWNMIQWSKVCCASWEQRLEAILRVKGLFTDAK